MPTRHRTGLWIACRLSELRTGKVKGLPLSKVKRQIEAGFASWLAPLEADYGDVPGEAMEQLAAEIWDQDDRRAPSVNPTR